MAKKMKSSREFRSTFSTLSPLSSSSSSSLSWSSSSLTSSKNSQIFSTTTTKCIPVENYSKFLSAKKLLVILCFNIFLLLTSKCDLVSGKNLDHHHQLLPQISGDLNGGGIGGGEVGVIGDNINNHPHQQSSVVGAAAIAGGGGSEMDKKDHLHPSSSSSSSSLSSSKVSCDAVKQFFDTINIAVEPDFINKGAICGGHCCTNATEKTLKQKSTSNFEQLLRHHTTSLRGILETTSNSFRAHVLELSHQSENKTLNVFSQVYRRMLPLSRQLIHDLYTSIRRYLTTPNEMQLEIAIHNFFQNLFPVAYHQAVHLNNDGGTGDLHDDYITCLKSTFDDLQPFGDIPKDLSKNLIQSVTAATVFINALEHGAEILASTEELDSMYLTSGCQTHLLKMSYCPECNGHSKHHAKSCYGYCLNVMRGCLAQYVGVLDGPWSNVAEAIERLVTTSVQSDSGIINIIKGLDGKLSEAIMRAMENGPDLEKKVKKTCGTPKMIPVDKLISNDIKPLQQGAIKWATPPDAELLHFLSTIEKSKDFYSKIVDNLCEDEEYQRNDRHCWTGDKIGDYTQTVMSTGVDAQRYNPEVPLVTHSYAQVTKLNELVDKLIKLRSTIVNALPTNPRSYSDIQGDMARHDIEEGSGNLRDDLDDDEYNNIHGSGAGSGDGPSSTISYNNQEIPKQTASGCPSQLNISIFSQLLLPSLVLAANLYFIFQH